MPPRSAWKQQDGPHAADAAVQGPAVLARYALAGTAALGALAVCLLLDPVLAPNFFVVFLGAVALSAWYGGFRPALLCAGLSVAASMYFFLEPVGSPGATGADLFKLGTFAAAAYLVSSLSAALHGARAAAEERAEEATRMATQLQEQAAELELQAEEMQTLNAELEEQVEEAAYLRERLEEANRELRAAGRAAEESRDRLAAVIETVAEGVVVTDTEGRLTLVNAAAERILHLVDDGVTGRHYVNLQLRRFQLDGTPLPPERHPVARVLREGVPVHAMLYRVEYPDGRRAVMRVNAAPLPGGEGGLAGVVASFADVTEEHRALDALRESEARFRALADSAPVLVWMAGTDALGSFFNRPWLEYTGRTVEEESGNGWTEGVHPDDRDRCLRVYLGAFEARRPFRMDYRLRRADGEYRWLMDSGVPRFTPDGEFAGFIGSCVDIHDRRQVEEQEHFLLRVAGIVGASLDYERTLAELVRSLIPFLADYCSIDLLTPEGEIRRVESAHADPVREATLRGMWARYPYARDEPHGVPQVLRTLRPVLLPEVPADETAAFARDAEHLRMLRELAPRSYLCVPLVARDRVLGALSLVMSDSGRRYTQADLQLAEKVARRAALAIDNARLFAAAVEANQAKTDFMAVMSHELRTPLNAVIGYTDLFLAGIPVELPPPLRPQVERIRTAARHLLRLIEEILTFSRIEAGREEVHPETVDAAVLAQEAAALAEPLALERGLGFRLEAPDPGPTLRTDAGKARQVLVNLLGNAVKFTEAGEVSLHVEEVPGAVVFTVHDTGVGIEREQLERIFDPFWQVDQSISRRSGGTGLGLSVARQLARLLDGEVTVESVPGDGSVFTFRLPSAPPQA